MTAAALTFALVLAIGWALFERIDKLTYREACECLEREVHRGPRLIRWQAREVDLS